MRARWEALHAALDRSVRSLQAQQAFQQARQHPALARFDQPFEVVEYLGGLSIAVGHRIEGRARLPGPLQVRRFLEELSELALRAAPSDVVRAHA